jgi:hypothetical protein
VFDNSLKKLARGKTPGLDNIPNEILKALHPTFHDMLFLFFRQCYHQKTYPIIGNTAKQYSSTKKAIRYYSPIIDPSRWPTLYISSTLAHSLPSSQAMAKNTKSYISAKKDSDHKETHLDKFKRS